MKTYIPSKWVHIRIQQQTTEMFSNSNTKSITVRHLLMKVFQARGSSLCLQPYGHPITTVLCFIPPRPQDWIKWMMPSRTLDATTTWQKPLTLSISIMFLIAYNMRRGQKKLINKNQWLGAQNDIITIKMHAIFLSFFFFFSLTLFGAAKIKCCLGAE